MARTLRAGEAANGADGAHRLALVHCMAPWATYAWLHRTRLALCQTESGRGSVMGRGRPDIELCIEGGSTQHPAHHDPQGRSHTQPDCPLQPYRGMSQAGRAAQLMRPPCSTIRPCTARTPWRCYSAGNCRRRTGCTRRCLRRWRRCLARTALALTRPRRMTIREGTPRTPPAPAAAGTSPQRSESTPRSRPARSSQRHTGLAPPTPWGTTSPRGSAGSRRPR